jgi:tetratricopeptide (TPR) repeat protein
MDIEWQERKSELDEYSKYLKEYKEYEESSDYNILKYVCEDSNDRSYTKDWSNNDIAYDETIKLDPNDANTWADKGFALRRQSEYDEAIRAYNKAIRLNLNHAESWYGMGIALDALGRTSEANAAYAKAKELGYKG